MRKRTPNCCRSVVLNSAFFFLITVFLTDLNTREAFKGRIHSDYRETLVNRGADKLLMCL